MKRTAVNPWEWSLQFGYNQAEIIEGTNRQVICAGQTSVDEAGKPQHPDNMRQQITLAVNNLRTTLESANMDLSNIIKLTIYTTDVDEAMKHFDILGMNIGTTGNKPPMSLLGVTRLALPSLMFEIEAIAAD